MKPMETDIETEADIVSNFYDIDKSSLLAERKKASASIALQKQEDILTASHKLIKWLHVGGIGDIIPTFKAAAIILATIPATSCSAERSFSALRRIKMTDIQREKKIQCHVVGHKMPSVTESRGTGRNFLAIYADALSHS